MAVELVTDVVVKLQSGTDRTVYATWKWSKTTQTKHYLVRWWYHNTDGQTVRAQESDFTTTQQYHEWTAPSNAVSAWVHIQPVSKTYKSNGKDVSYWTSDWSTMVSYTFKNNPPTTPPSPKSLEIEDYKLTVIYDNLDLNAQYLEIQVAKLVNGARQILSPNAVPWIKDGYVQYSRNIEAGYTYQVRARSVRNNLYSEWSEWSDAGGTKPSASSGITVIRAISKTSVYLAWSAVDNATSYELEYATKREYFDSSDQTQNVTGIKTTNYEKTGLQSGETYFFRVRAVNDQGESAWSGIKSIILGKSPSAPTTWSSTTRVVVGESVTLYWVHNSEDGSSQTFANLELIVDGVKTTKTIQNTSNEDEKDKTSTYTLKTSGYTDGATIQWRVRTAGVLTSDYGDWSVMRTIDVYAPPILNLAVIDGKAQLFDVLKSFPAYIAATSGPNTQTPIGYHVTVSANSAYETIDHTGNVKMVNKGEKVYSKYFNSTSYNLTVELSANNIDLNNNVSYTVTCVVSMDSGLTAEKSYVFRVGWTDVDYTPNAEIGINNNDYSAIIRPYCEDENGEVITGVTLAVYRREFDGKFTEIASGLASSSNMFITDPHPALDYARYRIVATDISTGAVSYRDLPGHPVGGNAIIIQWNEVWSTFDAVSEGVLAEPNWSGSMLKLPYNIDVSDKSSPDVSLVKYIGREHPVSYYGTQVGSSSTWKVAIDSKDRETIYALRRLSVWMGDVYVREPSGTGYWANVNVSFSQTHREVTIPVTIDVTRVEGGV